YASATMRTIEINGSFYALQRPSSYAQWYAETPPGFLFAVKGGRFITHNKKLADVETPLANFFASGVLRLQDKLGPFLWQLPPNLRFRPERVASFLQLLPRTTREAVTLGRKHDHRLEGRSWLGPIRNRALRHVIEPRHDSFLVPEFARLCRDHGVAIVFSDSADWPYTEEVTAGFVYLRLHGSQSTYASRYSDDELDRWAARIRAWQAGGQPDDAATFTGWKPPRHASRDAFVYFDNDAKVHAPKDAARLAERLGVERAAGA
ncbi:MAG TPA: DUF72 domain-containing protein, partial [Longimicrobiaceae bacterium]